MNFSIKALDTALNVSQNSMTLQAGLLELQKIGRLTQEQVNSMSSEIFSMESQLKELVSEREKHASYIELARASLDDDVQIDDLPLVSSTIDVEDAQPGVWVNSWMFIYQDEMEDA